MRVYDDSVPDEAALQQTERRAYVEYVRARGMWVQERATQGDVNAAYAEWQAARRLWLAVTGERED